MELPAQTVLLPKFTLTLKRIRDPIGWHDEYALYFKNPADKSYSYWLTRFELLVNCRYLERNTAWACNTLDYTYFQVFRVVFSLYWIIQSRVIQEHPGLITSESPCTINWDMIFFIRLHITLKSPPYGHSTEKSLWQFACQESPGDFTINSTGDSHATVL